MYSEKFKFYRKTRFLFDFLFYQLVKPSTKYYDKLKAKHSGKPMLIVGNGPSLNDTPLEKFHIASIGMNKINILFDRTNWRPDYIYCVNGLVMLQNKRFFKKTKIPVFLDVKAAYLGLFGRSIKYFLNNPNIDFVEKMHNGLSQGATVTHFALQFAYKVGANPIIIVGVDHSFKLNNDTASAIEKRQGVDENHFDPNYFKEGSLWGVPDFDNSELNYKVAKEKFEKKGVKIYDATIKGKLDIFEKISIEEALNLQN